jgi:hypothetical protein
VELRQPQLLAWALQQQQRLWGPTTIAALAAFTQLHTKACNPIWCRFSRQQQQQRKDLQELRQHHQQQLLERPAFAQQMADVAMQMLKVTPNAGLLLSLWLEQGLRYNRSDADVARAKAVLAAVAAARELPVGAGRVRQQALMRVLDTGDVDLLALFMCWANRAV